MLCFLYIVRDCMLTKDKGVLRPLKVKVRFKRMSVSTSIVILANPNNKEIFEIPL